MLKLNVTPQEVADLLNEMLKLDPAAVEALIATRVPANEALCDHPSIQTTSTGMVAVGPDGKNADKKIDVVGLLGVLNGLFGRHEAPQIATPAGAPDEYGLCHGFGAIVMRSDATKMPAIQEFVTLANYMKEILEAPVLNAPVREP